MKPANNDHTTKVLFGLTSPGISAADTQHSFATSIHNIVPMGTSHVSANASDSRSTESTTSSSPTSGTESAVPPTAHSSDSVKIEQVESKKLSGKSSRRQGRLAARDRSKLRKGKWTVSLVDLKV